MYIVTNLVNIYDRINALKMKTSFSSKTISFFFPVGAFRQPDILYKNEHLPVSFYYWKHRFALSEGQIGIHFFPFKSSL
jgi:hypothetical protein